MMTVPFPRARCRCTCQSFVWKQTVYKDGRHYGSTEVKPKRTDSPPPVAECCMTHQFCLLRVSEWDMEQTKSQIIFSQAGFCHLGLNLKTGRKVKIDCWDWSRTSFGRMGGRIVHLYRYWIVLSKVAALCDVESFVMRLRCLHRNVAMTMF